MIATAYILISLACLARTVLMLRARSARRDTVSRRATASLVRLTGWIRD